MRGEHSRRTFMIQAAGALALPLVITMGGSSCRRKLKQTVATSDTADDVENAASFRPPIPTAEPMIRVRVLRVRGADAVRKGLRFGDVGQWMAVHTVDMPGKGVALSGPLHVALEPGGWTIVDSNGFRPAVDPYRPLAISLIDAQKGDLIRVDELNGEAGIRAYPGVLNLVARQDTQDATVHSDAVPAFTTFDLVNHVPVELYLPGVLAGELYKTWHLETHAAQAVAARSFACTEAAVFASRRHYDVTNTASSQMYIGGGAHDRSQEAVAMTRGLVLAYEGLLVSGYYSSCCGGASASAVDAIGSNPVNNVAPLLGRSGSDVCTEASVFQWSAEQPIDVLTRRIIGYGQERRRSALATLTQLASIDVVAVNANGRPTRMRVVDQRDASAEISAEEFRRAANYTGQGLHPPPKPLKSSNIRASFTSTKVTFDGYGFGHGVGLCQYGAEALAKNGTQHQDILRWYYPSVELAKSYA
jgi:SpoIID/LytB domain protein